MKLPFPLPALARGDGPAGNLLPGDEPVVLPAVPRPLLDHPYVRQGTIPVTAPEVGSRERERVLAALDAGWISSTGPFLAEFEKTLARTVSCPDAVVCNSGTSALQLAVSALGLGPGDEVIVPTFTMIATGNAVFYSGAKLVLVDVDPHTHCLTPHQVEPALSPRTRAILVVHPYGYPAGVDDIVRLVADKPIAVIEDAAGSIGARRNGAPVGSLGHFGAFSFYGNKIVSTGEGGALVSRVPELLHRARLLRDHAFTPGRHFWHEIPAYNFRMGSLQAALGLAQLERLESFLAHRQRVAQWYRARLEGTEGLRLNPEPTGTGDRHAHWVFGLCVEENAFGISRNALRARLAQKGIETRTLYVPLHLQPIYREDPARFPAANLLCRDGVYLPTAQGVDEALVDYICTVILKG